MEYSQNQLEKYFPIESQTSSNDKVFLLNAIKLANKRDNDYSYVEIGSFLGGSLSPFLMDTRCKLVLSIDDRERQQEDERGKKFDYAGVTHQTMIDNLKARGISTEKLKTFDGSIDTISLVYKPFDLAFIDGEHTDFACFRDFLWLLPMMKKDAVVMFHDSTLIYKALRLIQLYLKKSGLRFRFFKKADSEMSSIFFGECAEVNFSESFGEAEDLDKFYDTAETAIINHLVANRVVVQFSTKVIPLQTVPAF